MSKILLVEDEESLSNMYAFELVRRNFELMTASDGQEALMVARGNKPDFIILDIMLPKIDGIGVFKELLREPTTQNIPVGFLSALGKDIADFVGEDRDILSKAEFFLQKDKCTPQQVVDEVEKALKKSN